MDDKRDGSPSFELKNEFGGVRVWRSTEANDPRLGIEHLRTGRTIYLDPLELEALAHCRGDVFRELLRSIVYLSSEPGGAP